ncbi:hypothetical protein MRB53_041164 [Persea americana]|nr:hypothetical protein MRB53_041164 [Persea americana]
MKISEGNKVFCERDHIQAVVFVAPRSDPGAGKITIYTPPVIDESQDSRHWSWLMSMEGGRLSIIGERVGVFQRKIRKQGIDMIPLGHTTNLAEDEK